MSLDPETALGFAALGEPLRLALIERLIAEGPLPTARLAERAGITRQGLTKHLEVLESARLLTSRKAGRQRLWAVQGARLTLLRRRLERLSAQWDARLEALRAMVEDD